MLLPVQLLALSKTGKIVNCELNANADSMNNPTTLKKTINIHK